VRYKHAVPNPEFLVEGVGSISWAPGYISSSIDSDNYGTRDGYMDALNDPANWTMHHSLPRGESGSETFALQLTLDKPLTTEPIIETVAITSDFIEGTHIEHAAMDLAGNLIEDRKLPTGLIDYLKWLSTDRRAEHVLCVYGDESGEIPLSIWIEVQSAARQVRNYGDFMVQQAQKLTELSSL
jgi:hypothetical protein